METQKKIFIFQGTKLSYVLGNGNPKKLIFHEVTFEAQKKKTTLKKFLIFREMELSNPKKLKTFSNVILLIKFP